MTYPRTYIGDDFDAWTVENNDAREPIIQYQTPLNPLPLGHLGGWVLQKPNLDEPHNYVAIPLQAQNEAAARAEAGKILKS
jgi:hypothetical protein